MKIKKKRKKRKPEPTEIKVGTYDLGHENVDVYAVLNDQGGSYHCNPNEGGPARVRIGIRYNHWWETVNVATHEAFEFILDRMELKFRASGDTSRDSAAVLFVFTHSQFSEASARVAYFLTKLLPDLAMLYNKWKKK